MKSALRVWPASAGMVLVAGAAHAAGAGADGETAGAFWYELGNLLLLASLLVFLARRPVLAQLAERRKSIQQELADSAGLRSAAERRQGEWQRRVDGLDQEVAGIRSSTRAAAEQESKRVVAAAAVTAERIRAGAAAVAERERFQARGRLRRETAHAALSRAAELLGEQVQQADHERLVDEFISYIEAGGAGAAAPVPGAAAGAGPGESA